MANIEIKKVVLKIGSKEIPLSLEEAKELKSILNDTFPEKEIQWLRTPPYSVYPLWPYQQWSYINTGDASDTLYLSKTTQG